MNLSKLFTGFFESEKSGGFILVIMTALSLLVANSTFGEGYIQFWNMDVGGHSLTHWINDGLMTIFFLLIGLELEREIYQGELSTLKNASLPVIGALGGILVPAGIFLVVNYGLKTQPGAGIPMATDIAFAIGILSLLGNKVPTSLKIFLTALAVIDDLGAILVIAIFYTKTLVWLNLIISLSIFASLLALNRLKVRNLVPYLLGGIAMWYFMLNSGVHATITGVLLAFAIPFGNGDERSTSYILQQSLHKPVAFFILPLFAMANTGFAIGMESLEGLSKPGGLGIIAGLVIGKPLGIFLFSCVGAAIGLCSLPADLKWKHIFGAAMLGGIGFTMSIFITLLAYEDAELINEAKIAILAASIIAALSGLLFLKKILSAQPGKPA
ncbi:MAG: Na+/H+ antiporter NhaA [Bacteroidota bacterium]